MRPNVRSTLRVFGSVIVVSGSLAVLGLVPFGSAAGPPDFGAPLANLTAQELARFAAGQEEFVGVETVAEGVGPVFNDTSCATCHGVPAIGGGSPRLETRFGRLHPDGTFDPMSEYGGSLLQTSGIGPQAGCEYVAEIVPGGATIVAHRRATPLFGLGLVDAVPDAVFRLLALAQRLDPDGIAGTVSDVTNLSTGKIAVGKFGWKGQNPTLFQFSGDAYVNEMGITNPQFPSENCPQGDCSSLSCNPMADLNDDGTGVQQFADFMTMLAPPPRGPIGVNALVGELRFAGIGCASCHVSTLVTGASSIQALNKVAFHPYSDFLLHDMGSLGDGITQNKATGKLMRTAPLWGLRRITTFLHDGQAATLEAAIAAHDGQARKARDRFSRLSAPEKAQLIAFLNSL